MKRIEREQAKTLLKIAKKHKWLKTIRSMEEILADKLQPLDPEIFGSVIQLAKMGLETVASCAGHRARRCRCLPPGRSKERYYSGYINYIPLRPFFTDNLVFSLMHQGIIPLAVDLFLGSSVTGIGISYYQEDDGRPAIRLSWSFEKYKELKVWWKQLEMTLKAVEEAVCTKLHPITEINGVPVKDLISVIRVEE